MEALRAAGFACASPAAMTCAGGVCTNDDRPDDVQEEHNTAEWPSLPSWIDPLLELDARDDLTDDLAALVRSQAPVLAALGVTGDRAAELLAHAATETGRGRRAHGHNWGGVKLKERDDAEALAKTGRGLRWWRDFGHAGSGHDKVAYYRAFEDDAAFWRFFVKGFVGGPSLPPSSDRYPAAGRAFWGPTPAGWFVELLRAGYRGRCGRRRSARRGSPRSTSPSSRTATSPGACERCSRSDDVCRLLSPRLDGHPHPAGPAPSPLRVLRRAPSRAFLPPRRSQHAVPKPADRRPTHVPQILREEGLRQVADAHTPAQHVDHAAAQAPHAVEGHRDAAQPPRGVGDLGHHHQAAAPPGERVEAGAVRPDAPETWGVNGLGAGLGRFGPAIATRARPSERRGHVQPEGVALERALLEEHLDAPVDLRRVHPRRVRDLAVRRAVPEAQAVGAYDGNNCLLQCGQQHHETSSERQIRARREGVNQGCARGSPAWKGEE